MLLSWMDWAVPIVYFLITLGLGLYAGKKGKNSPVDYFLQGRSAPWWLAGTGMVATTFAADTPLAVTLLTAESGISGNWIWWSMAIGGMFTVFFFARVWSRAGVLTDLEFIEFRYTGVKAALLRGFKSVYFGLIINTMVIGWVHLAMSRIFEILFPEIHPALGVTLLALFTVLYVSYTGLRGVAFTDAFQFVVAMAGSITLAVYVLSSAQIEQAGGLVQAISPEKLSFLPALESGTNDSSATGNTISILAFFTFIAVQWWASWYPGAEPGGGGYIAQRIMSARSERDGFFATLWFVIAHYALRPWPWIIAALATLVLYPSATGGEREATYVALIRDFLPGPLRGLLFAAFAGAYMSTLSTQLNWGSSYLLNDLYARFFDSSHDEKRRVHVARWITVVLLLVSLTVTFTVLETVRDTWTILLEFGAGTGLILILRWYYWRVNAITEIVSLVVPATGTILIRLILPYWMGDAGDSDGLLFSLQQFPGTLLLNTALTIIVVIPVMFLTRPESEDHLSRFYTVVRPAGPGWKKFQEKTGLKSKDRPWFMLVGWISATGFVYSSLFFVGSLLFFQWDQALLYGVGVLVTPGIIVYSIRRMHTEEEQQKSEPMENP